MPVAITRDESFTIEDMLADGVWALARAHVLGVGYEDRPFSPFDGDEAMRRRSALAEIEAVEFYWTLLAKVERLAVHRAKKAGASFVEMGDAAGITRQAARKRFA